MFHRNGSQELYEEYKKEQRGVFSRDPAGLTEALCTPTYFNKVWRCYFPELKLKPNGDFMLCQKCTLLKELVHGQAGSRGIQNQAEKDEYMREYEAHVEVG